MRDSLHFLQHAFFVQNLAENARRGRLHKFWIVLPKIDVRLFKKNRKFVTLNNY